MSIRTHNCNVKIIQLFMMTRTVITLMLNKHYVVCKVLSVFCGLKDPSGWAGGGTTLPEELLPSLSLKAWNVEPPAAQHVSMSTVSPLLISGYHGTLNLRTFQMCSRSHLTEGECEVIV